MPARDKVSGKDIQTPNRPVEVSEKDTHTSDRPVGLSKALMDIYAALRGHLGHQHWWPGETPLEIFVGAILTQQTAWTNVEKAIANLKSEGMLDLKRIAECGKEKESERIKKLEEVIRPSGYYRQKAKRLSGAARYILENYGTLEGFFMLETQRLRKELLSINGIGPETADSIILYAAERPVFVVDAYTFRILNRLGIYTGKKDYHTLQALFHSALPPDLDVYQDFHAQFVVLGKNYCRSRPLCNGCPLRERCGFASVPDSG